MLSQSELELIHSKRKAFEAVLDHFTGDELGMDLIADSVEVLEEWAKQPAEYEKKQLRKDTLLNKMNIADIVQTLFVEVLTSKSRLSIANAAGLLANKTDMGTAYESIKLAGEVIAIISIYGTGVYVLERERKGDTYYLTRTLEMPEDLYKDYHSKMYMPPMIDKPKLLSCNSDSPYQEHDSGSLILKPKFNYHNGNISLDVLNRQNAIALKVDVPFFNDYQEVPKFEDLGTAKSRKEYKKHLQMLENWDMHLELSDYTCQLMIDNGNKFYIPNKVDKRGRIYCQGHYINPMGTSYKKAIVSFHKEETINVPKGFFK